MQERSLRVLEYSKIIEKLIGFCTTSGGRERAQHLKPTSNKIEVEKALDLTDEALGMILRNGKPPLTQIINIKDCVNRAYIGSTLSMKELLSVAGVLRVVRDMNNYFRNDTQLEFLKKIDKIFDVLIYHENLEKDIHNKILTEEEIADDASRELLRIRREITFKNKKIADKLNSLISSTEYEKYLQDRIITFRDNRYVVPVKKEYRQSIKGIVLDKSASGSTLFIEPIAVVELNNDLKILAMEEEKEIFRILKELSDSVASYRIELLENYEALVDLDFIFAKAKYALSINGTKPILSEEGSFYLQRAKHPLIDAKKVVASDIYLNENIKTMVITGPNTGGKTVTLKTLGLLTLMAESGMFIPVRENSKITLFSDIYADIGDEQSIEQSLSTFSSHMTNIVKILEKADKKSLVLFDELGAGTDPTEGAALAISILNMLHQKGITTIATTHYSELKAYALLTKEVENASVEFDIATLKPTYKLLIGVPGKSNAFEIAQRLGLNDSIVEDAKLRIDENSERFEEILIKIEEKNQNAEKALTEARRILEKARKERDKVVAEQITIENRNKELIKKAQIEAQCIVEETRERSEYIYKEIRRIQENTIESMQDNKKLEELRREMAGEEAKILGKYKSNYVNSVSGLTLNDVDKGMKVYIKSLHRNGEVINILPKEEKVMVISGNIKLKIDVSDLSKSVEVVKPKEKQVQYKMAEKNALSARLDLRGRNGDESIFLLEKALADAVVTNTTQIIVIHGKGTGKLRQVIHNYLKECSIVSAYRFGAPNEGGVGATIVEL